MTDDEKRAQRERFRVEVPLAGALVAFYTADVVRLQMALEAATSGSAEPSDERVQALLGRLVEAMASMDAAQEKLKETFTQAGIDLYAGG